MLRQIARRIERLERRRVSTPDHPIDQKARLDQFESIRDPIEFSRLAFNHDPWGMQAKILESVAKNRRTAVKACHSSGKTFCAADAVLWWITAHPDGIAVTTAPTWTQVERLLWGEIRKSVAVSAIRYPTPLKTRLDLGPNRYALGLSTNEGVRFQGWHGKILIVIDEAPGVRPEIYEAIEGIRAGGDVRVLALGNPTIASGPFYDAFTVNREGWSLFTIGAFDTPNLTGLDLESLLALTDDELDENVRPYLTTRRWVKEKFHEWGLGHPLWESRVLGNFPKQSQDALISLTWLEQAKQRELRADQQGCHFIAGVDVAGPGEDETVLAIRQGNNIVEIRSFRQQDARGELMAALLPYQGRLGFVNVDAAGIGWYMARHLAEYFSVQAINVGEAATNPERFVNLKAELYWGVRMRFEGDDVAGLADDKAIAQLASIRYQHNARGQVVIESKEDARKRGVRSPDRAEAVMLAFAPEIPRDVQGVAYYYNPVSISPM
jgi:phage terminase large subunit